MNKEDLATLEKLSQRQILSPLQVESALCEEFHENTKLNRINAAGYSKVIQAVIQEPKLTSMMTESYKVYSLVDERFELEKPTPESDLERTLIQRRSRRRYTGEPIHLDELGRLCWYSYGRTGEPPAPDYFRPVASGGALFPLEIYFLVFDVEGAEPGIYHYDQERHALQRIRTGDFREQAQDLLFEDGIDLENASAVVLFSAVLRRTLLKYQDRGYRMALIEAGEAAQNLSLVATALGLGCVWLGGFYDDELNRLVGLDEVNEPILLPGVLGRLERAKG